MLALGYGQPLGQVSGRGVYHLVIAGNAEVERPTRRRPHSPGRVGTDYPKAGLGPIPIKHPLIKPDLGRTECPTEHTQVQQSPLRRVQRTRP